MPVLSTTALRRRRPRVRPAAPLLVVLAVLLPLWAFVAWFGLVYPQGLLEAQRRELAAGSRALAALGAAVLQRAQSGLQTLDLWMAEHPGPPDEPALRRIGEITRDKTLRLLDLALLDRRGRVLPITDGLPADKSHALADWPLLAALRRQAAGAADEGAGLIVGEPLRLPGDASRLRLPLALPLSAPSEDLIGVVALLDVDRLAAQLHDFADRPHEVVLLMRSDGVILVRAPELPDPPGSNAFNGQELNRTAFTAAAGSFESDGSGGDGVARRGAYQSLPRFDVQALVMDGAEEALLAYGAQRRLLLGMSLLFSTAVAGAGLLSARSVRRERLRKAEERAAVDASPVGLFRCDLAGRLSYANDTYLRLLGLPGIEQAAPWGWLALLPQPEREEARVHWAAQMARREPALLVRPLRRPDGRTRLIALRTAPLLLDDGRLLGQSGTLEDITEREAQDQAGRTLLAIFETTPDYVIQLDPAGNMVYANPAARRFLDLPAEGGLRGLDFPRYCTPERLRRYYQEALPAALREGHWQGCGAVLDPRTGREVPVDVMVLVHHGRQERLALISMLMRNVSADLEALMKLTQRAETLLPAADTSLDTLTGLPDAPAFERRLATLRPDSANSGAEEAPRLCLFYLALEGFAQVGAEHGESMADAVLKAVAARLRHVLRPRDLLAHARGGEFRVLVPELRSEADAALIAGKLEAALERPLRIGQALLRLRLSVGFCVAKPGESDGEALMAAAQARLQQARIACDAQSASVMNTLCGSSS